MRAEYIPGMLYRLSASDPVFCDAAVLIRSEKKRAMVERAKAIQNASGQNERD